MIILVVRYQLVEIKAIDLVNGDTIIKEFRGHEDIYNILLKTHCKMIVNKLNVETLNPNNFILNKNYYLYIYIDNEFFGTNKFNSE